MKKSIKKIACVAALVLPALAMAANTKTYNGNTDGDKFKFTIDSLAPAYDASILASWSDMQLTGGSAPVNNEDYAVTWTLTERGVVAPVASGSLGLLNLFSGTQLLTFSGLTAGKYTLKLDGSWADMVDQPKHLTKVRGMVDLVDDDLANQSAGNSFHVTAVPEPETYAMMLAGLMLVSTIARRRRKS
jgi:hypothetical protein